MKKIKQYIGLDVHKDTISIATAPGGSGFEVRDLGELPHDVPRLKKKLLELGESADLFVASPSREVEALRDVLRAREDSVRALRSARQQLSSFLLRHDKKWNGKTTWTQLHLDWTRTQRFDSEAQRQVLEDYVQEVSRLTTRVGDWDRDTERFAEQCESVAPTYKALQALRGVSTIVAATIVAEFGDLRRFSSASKLMSYLGLVPSERSSGPRVARGAITKTGNPHVRWKLVQAAWQYRHRPAMTRTIKKRRPSQGSARHRMEGAEASQPALPGHELTWKAGASDCDCYRT